MRRSYLRPFRGTSRIPSFSNLFVQTEYCPRRVADRTTARRAASDPFIWQAHVLADGGLETELNETDRGHFVGADKR